MTKDDLRRQQERLNDTIIEKNDLISRLIEQMSSLMADLKQCRSDNKKIRRKLYARREG